MWRSFSYTVLVGVLGYAPAAHAQTGWDMSVAGWAIYGVPLAFLGLIAPWILARKGLKFFLSLALVGWIYAWLVATFLNPAFSIRPADGAPPLGLIELAIGYIVYNDPVVLLVTAIGFGLPVWGGMFTIWRLSKKTKANFLVQSIGGILVGAVLCIGARTVTFMSMLFLLAVFGRLT